MSSEQDELILGHQDYLRALARQIHKTLPAHVSYEELVAFGQVGLAEAAGNYDPTRGVAFSTFAYYRVRGAIFDGIRDSTWLPPSLRRRFDGEAGMNSVLEEQAQGPETGESREAMARRLREGIRAAGAVLLASQLPSEEDRGSDAEDRSSSASSLEDREIAVKLSRAIEGLPEHIRRVMHLHYFEHKSLSEIARAVGKDKATTSRWHAQAIKQLREAIIGGEESRMVM